MAVHSTTMNYQPNLPDLFTNFIYIYLLYLGEKLASFYHGISYINRKFFHSFGNITIKHFLITVRIKDAVEGIPSAKRGVRHLEGLFLDHQNHLGGIFEAKIFSQKCNKKCILGGLRGQIFKNFLNFLKKTCLEFYSLTLFGNFENF